MRDRSNRRRAETRKHLKPPVRSRRVGSENRPGVQVPAPADEAAQRAPVRDPTAGHVSRAQHKIGPADPVEKHREVTRRVRVVRVHLEDDIVSFSRRVVEAGKVRRGQTQPPRPDEQVNPALAGAHLFHHVGGAVGRAVVHDQHVDGRRPAHIPEQMANALALVVGRDHHEGTGVRRQRPLGGSGDRHHRAVRTPYEAAAPVRERPGVRPSRLTLRCATTVPHDYAHTERRSTQRVLSSPSRASAKGTGSVDGRLHAGTGDPPTRPDPLRPPAGLCALGPHGHGTGRAAPG